MIGSNDERAQGLLEDLKKDPLAKEIINRVDNSPYGVQGRRREQEIQQETGGATKNRSGARHSRSTSPADEHGQASLKSEDKLSDFHSTHPTTEWQDIVSTMLRNGSQFLDNDYGDQEHPNKRQRCQVSVDRLSDEILSHGTSFVRGAQESSDSSGNSQLDDDITEAVGQLSLNEDEEVRYHGKVSGLHLLDGNDRIDRRNEGGIWRFPTARVWPPLPSNRQNAADAMVVENNEDLSKLPDSETQDHLLELYFTYVHPSLPVIHKRSFFEVFKNTQATVDLPDSPKSDANSSVSSSALNRRRQRIPTLLLLAMYAIAERYSPRCAPPPQDGSMWAAGDAYLDSAKTILNGTYANSRPSTCQALLLLGYREIGIGAMAQAWVYIGMAVRMAQDLGMHRSADGWFRVGLGGKLFGEWELQERKRIWYSCVIMDKYVSTYIGRPLAIFDRDYDTLMPSDEEPEEMEVWKLHPSKPVTSGSWEPKVPTDLGPAPGRIISCFNASATLSALLGRMFVAIYGIRPVSSRHTESMHFERLLDKWYIELPEHLRFDPGSLKTSLPQPHVLTLHMQYWCTVLLLHRPFIRDHKNNFDGSSDDEVNTIIKKKYELCAAAANHITSIASSYSDNYCLSRSAVFLCYYVFTASVMHVISLSKYPSDPQARLGLTKCMDALENMKTVWPSAGRALELLRGSRVNLGEPIISQPCNIPDRPKRAADQSFETDSALERSHPHTQRPSYMHARPNTYRSSSYPDLQDGLMDVFNLNTATPSGGSLPYYSSHERWPSNSYTAASFPGPLLAMPELYSSGLVDDQASGIRYRSQVADDQASNPARYSQYWSDLSSFPQLSPTYGATSMQADPGVMPQPPYMSGQYNLYTDA
jgi:hypothetical protein